MEETLKTISAEDVMGLQQSKPDMYVLLTTSDVAVCPLGVFSTFEEAKDYVDSNVGDGRKLWIEKFRLDDPQYYEADSDYIMWMSS